MTLKKTVLLRQLDDKPSQAVHGIKWPENQARGKSHSGMAYYKKHPNSPLTHVHLQTTFISLRGIQATSNESYLTALVIIRYIGLAEAKLYWIHPNSWTSKWIHPQLYWPRQSGWQQKIPVNTLGCSLEEVFGPDDAVDGLGGRVADGAARERLLRRFGLALVAFGHPAPDHLWVRIPAHAAAFTQRGCSRRPPALLVFMNMKFHRRPGSVKMVVIELTTLHLTTHGRVLRS